MKENPKRFRKILFELGRSFDANKTNESVHLPYQNLHAGRKN